MSYYEKDYELTESLDSPDSHPVDHHHQQRDEKELISSVSASAPMPITPPAHKMDSDDFERLDDCTDYPSALQQHPGAATTNASLMDDEDDILQLGYGNNAPKNGALLAGLHSSTDRPLVTIDESTAQKSPASTPTPSDKQFTLLGGEEEDDDDDDYLKNRQEPDLLSGFCRAEEISAMGVVKGDPELSENKSEDLFGLGLDSGYVDVSPPSAPIIEEKQNIFTANENPLKYEEEVEEEPPRLVETQMTQTAVVITPAKMVAIDGDCWFHPIADLIYWRDVKKTGAVFGSLLVVLLSLTYFSLISVTAYLLLAVMTGTLSYRIYKNVLQAVQKSNEGHPFKTFLEMDLVVPQDKVKDVVEVVVKHTNCTVSELRRLFLVEDLVDSIKFAIMLWCFTYIGAWFNGLTLIILAFVGLFTLPKVYETYKVQIDHYVGIILAQVNDVVSKIKAKIPTGKKPKEQ
jgi:reticulon-1